MSKVVNYQIDGTGRDTYIYSTNGGFYQRKTQENDESFVGIMKNSSLPNIKSKINLYHTDGSGRDTYINENQGGFYSYSPKINFLSNLRFYERSPERIRDNDFLRRSQLTKPVKAVEREQKQHDIMERVTQRLRLPKILGVQIHKNID